MKIYLLVAIVFLSCNAKTIPLKGNYSDGNFEAITDKSKEQVWDNTIDFFSKSGLSIKIIDRASGLIVSEETTMISTFENSKGQLINPNAWVVTHTVISPATRKPVKYYNITAEWNIRIKEKDGKTMINVNLVNPTYTSYVDSKVKFPFNKGTCQSTGVLENLIYNKVK